MECKRELGYKRQGCLGSKKQDFFGEQVALLLGELSYFNSPFGNCFMIILVSRFDIKHIIEDWGDCLMSKKCDYLGNKKDDFSKAILWFLPFLCDLRNSQVR